MKSQFREARSFFNRPVRKAIRKQVSFEFGLEELKAFRRQKLRQKSGRTDPPGLNPRQWAEAKEF